MVGKEIVSEKVICVPYVRKVLEEIEKKEELEYEQRITLDHSRNFSLVSTTDSEKMDKELRKKVDRLDDFHTASIINIMPRTPDEVRLLFAKDRYKLEDKEITAILDIVKDYLPKK